MTIAARVLQSRFFTALQYREFRKVWYANGSAQAAAWALIVTRGWLVFETTGSSFWVGATTFAAMAPQLVVPPIAGVLADRLDRRTVLAWTYSVNLVHSCFLVALAATGVLEVWMLVALSLVNGAARATQMPTSQALSASLVPRDKLLNALALSASTQHGSRLIGPGLVTPVLALAGAPAAFLVCTALYGIGLLQVLSLERREPVRSVSEQGYLANFVSGLGYVYQRPLFRFIIMLAVLHCSLTMAFESLLPSFSAERLTDDASGFGPMLVGVGAGALVASVFVSGIQTSKAQGNTLLAMGFLSGAGQVLLSFSTALWMAAAAAAIMGGAQAAFMTMAQATTQANASDEFRGRVASINSFALGGAMAFMNLANGSLATQVGAHNILLVDGFLFIGAVLLGLFVQTGRRAYGRTPVAEAGTA